MDVDAFTGGYNVQIALSTGYIAGIIFIRRIDFFCILFLIIRYIFLFELIEKFNIILMKA